MTPQLVESKELSGMTKWRKRKTKNGDFTGITTGGALCYVSRKKVRSAAGKKLPLKRRVKLRLFSSPLPSDGETEMEAEPDTSSYAPAKIYRNSNLRTSSSPLSIDRKRESQPPLQGANGRSQRRPLSRRELPASSSFGKERSCKKDMWVKSTGGPGSSTWFDGRSPGWTMSVSRLQNCCETGDRRRCHRNPGTKSPKFSSLIVIPPGVATRYPVPLERCYVDLYGGHARSLFTLLGLA